MYKLVRYLISHQSLLACACPPLYKTLKLISCTTNHPTCPSIVSCGGPGMGAMIFCVGPEGQLADSQRIGFRLMDTPLFTVPSPTLQCGMTGLSRWCESPPHTHTHIAGHAILSCPSHVKDIKSCRTHFNLLILCYCCYSCKRAERHEIPKAQAYGTELITILMLSKETTRLCP